MSEIVISDKVFKIIKDYPNYAISKCGVVVNIRNGNIMQHNLRGASTTTDYYYVGISNDVRVKKYLVHRLLAEYWIPNPDCKPSVNHKDGNKHNNYISNLEWVTRSENQRHAIETGLKGKGDLLYNSELLEDDVHLVCRHLVDGWLILDIANKFSVSKDIIRKIRAGEESSVSIYTDDKVHEVCRLLQEGKLSQIAIARTVGVDKTLVNGVKSGTSWLHISKNYVIPKPSQKLTDDIVVQVCEMLQSGASYKDILNTLCHPRLNRHTLRHIKNRNTFKHIVYKYDWINAQRLSCRVK